MIIDCSKAPSLSAPLWHINPITLTEKVHVLRMLQARERRRSKDRVF